MKKIFIAIIFAVLLTFLSFWIAAPIVNDNISRNIANELAQLPLPDNTECIETVYQSGKLTGNGNGMQYFGAILIKSEHSLEELKKYYLNFAENEWECIVENQIDDNIKIIEHKKLTFQAKIESDNYYIVYSWGNNDTIFHEFDIRGH